MAAGTLNQVLPAMYANTGGQSRSSSTPQHPEPYLTADIATVESTPHGSHATPDHPFQALIAAHTSSALPELHMVGTVQGMLEEARSRLEYDQVQAVSSAQRLGCSPLPLHEIGLSCDPSDADGESNHGVDELIVQ